MNTKPFVAVLIATYNPDVEFLDQQLISISNQIGVDIQIYWSDDGSNPEQINQIENIFSKYNHIRLVSANPRLGATNNFLFMIQKTNDMRINYYSFADQDDIWLPNKLIKHVRELSQYEEIVACTHSNSILLKSDTLIPKINRCQDHKLKTLIVENCFQGCTMVFNRRCRDLIASRLEGNITWHDWAIGTIVSVVGKVLFIEGIDTIYRIHPKNTIGHPVGTERFFKLINRPERQLYNQISSLNAIFDFLNLHEAKRETSRWLMKFQNRRFNLKMLFDDIRNRRLIDDIVRKCLSAVRVP